MVVVVGVQLMMMIIVKLAFSFKDCLDNHNQPTERARQLTSPWLGAERCFFLKTTVFFWCSSKAARKSRVLEVRSVTES